MIGELWQPCESEMCEKQPACAGCFYCERHCTCTAEARAERERQQRERERERQQRERERERLGAQYQAWVEEQTRGLVYVTTLPAQPKWERLAHFGPEVPGTWYSTGSSWYQAVNGDRVLMHSYGNAVVYYAPEHVANAGAQRWWELRVGEVGEQLAALDVLAYTATAAWANTLGADVKVRLVALKGRDYFLNIARGKPLLVGSLRWITPYDRLLGSGEIPLVMLERVKYPLTIDEAVRYPSPSGRRPHSIWRGKGQDGSCVFYAETYDCEIYPVAYQEPGCHAETA